MRPLLLLMGREACKGPGPHLQPRKTRRPCPGRVLTMAWMVLLLWLLTYDPGQGLGLCILWGISKQSLRVLVSITIPVCLLLLLMVDA